MRKKRKLGNFRRSPICFFLIWSKRTSRSSICGRPKRVTRTCSRRIVSITNEPTNQRWLYVDKQLSKKEKLNVNSKIRSKVERESRSRQRPAHGRQRRDQRSVFF